MAKNIWSYSRVNSNEIYHADFKYIKKVPLPGGGFRYIYPEDEQKKPLDASYHHAYASGKHELEEKAKRDDNVGKQAQGYLNLEAHSRQVKASHAQRDFDTKNNAIKSAIENQDARSKAIREHQKSSQNANDFAILEKKPVLDPNSGKARAAEEKKRKQRAKELKDALNRIRNAK